MQELIDLLVEDIKLDKHRKPFQACINGKLERAIRMKRRELGVTDEEYRKALQQARQIALAA